MKQHFLICLLIVYWPLSATAIQPGQSGWDNTVLSFADAKSAADNGDAYAQAVVSIYYSLGWKTEKNVVLALKYALSSAKAGHPLGIYRVGAALRSGDGTEKNEPQGLAIQQKSFDGLNSMTGNPYAITSVGVMVFQGKVIKENKQEAVRLYKIAAAMGYAPATFNYITAAIEGQGVEKDKVAYYHFGNPTIGTGCKCAVCDMGIADLADYPPAKAYIWGGPRFRTSRSLK